MSIEIKPFTIQDLVVKPHHYARYGDGNFMVLAEARKPNCDGHKHVLPGMKQDVERTITHPKRSITYGLTPFALSRCARAIERYMSPDMVWWNGDIWMDGILAGDMREFIGFLKLKKVAVVAPPHFAQIERYILPEIHIETGINCYKQKDEVLRTLKNEATHFDVVVFAASFLSCTAIYELTDLWPNKWLIDVGSGLDPACGVMSRAYHKKTMPWSKIYGIQV